MKVNEQMGVVFMTLPLAATALMSVPLWEGGVTLLLWVVGLHMLGDAKR